jgi:hypothetical protein
MDGWLKIGSHGGLQWSTDECLGSITAENCMPIWMTFTVQRNLYAPMNETLSTAVDMACITSSTWCIYGFYVLSNSVNFPIHHQLICLCNWQGMLLFWEVWTERFKYLLEWNDTVWKPWVEYFIYVFSCKNVGSCEAIFSWRQFCLTTLLVKLLSPHCRL